MNILNDFIKDSLAKGASRSDITEVLQKAGWQSDEIRTALNAYADVPFVAPVPKRKPYASAQEAFLYLVLFLTLYVSAINLGILLFQFINNAFPDLIASSYTRTNIIDSARQAIASLIIAYPIFIALSLFLKKSTEKDPERRSSLIRKWLTYLTLFFAAGTIIGDLIAAMTNLLNGDFTIRFLLKVLVVGGIAGIVFGYYLWDLKRDDQNKEIENTKKKIPPKSQIAIMFLYGPTAVILTSIVFGFFFVGSPQEARLKRFDAERISDLEQIRYSIISSYTDSYKRLPVSIDEARKSSGMPQDIYEDPATHEVYEYAVIDESTYTLCATFDAPSSEQDIKENPMWEHGVGKQCFSIPVAEASGDIIQKGIVRPVPVE